MTQKHYLDKLATGKLPLLVCVVAASAYWWLVPVAASAHEPGSLWGRLLAFLPAGVCAAAGYVLSALGIILLAVLTVSHALIRVQSTFYMGLYALLSACLLPHVVQAGQVWACCLALMFLSLFHTYQRVEPVDDVFRGFFFYGVGVLFFPQGVWLLPFLLGMQAWFHNVTLRTFFAALLGACLPAWFLLAYAYGLDDMELLRHTLGRAVDFKAIDYAGVGPVRWAGLGVVVALTLWCCVCYAGRSYQDKIRTRLFLYYVMTIEAICLLFFFLQPQHYDMLVGGGVVPCSSLLAGQYFAVNRDRRAFVASVVTLVLLAALYAFNLWIRLFSFS